MPNIKIDITKNGTTTLATVGKYCDRNIDIAVNVESIEDTEPTYTNLYAPENVIIDNYIGSSSTPDSFTSSTEANVLKIPYHHIADEPVIVRMRGLSTVRSRYHFFVTDANDSVVTRGQWHNYGTMSFDDNGDAVWTMDETKGGTTAAWEYLYITFQYPYVLSADSGLDGPIVTINEKIG